MDVIFYAAGLNRGAPDIRQYPHDVGMQLLPDFWCEPRGSVFRAEDGMDQNGGKGLRHGSDCIAALQAAGPLGGLCPGLRPSLLNGRPFGPDPAPLSALRASWRGPRRFHQRWLVGALVVVHPEGVEER